MATFQKGREEKIMNLVLIVILVIFASVGVLFLSAVAHKATTDSESLEVSLGIVFKMISSTAAWISSMTVWLFHWLNGKDLPIPERNIVNGGFSLADEEIFELVDALDFLVKPTLNPPVELTNDGWLIFDITASGYIDRYKEVEKSIIQNVVYMTVKNFYQRKRKIPHTQTVVMLAYPNHLQFKIATTIDADNHFQEELAAFREEEIIDLFSNSILEEDIE